MTTYEKPSVQTNDISRQFLFKTQATGLQLVPSCDNDNCDAFEQWFCGARGSDFWEINLELEGISCGEIPDGATFEDLGCQIEAPNGSQLSNCDVVECTTGPCTGGSILVRVQCFDESPNCFDSDGNIEITCGGGTISCQED